MSKKFSVTVPDYVFEDLELLAQIQGRPTATLAAFLLEVAMRQARERGELPPKEQTQEKTA
ncbi:ribbon-helix-helix domain-containing protein [Nostoc sp. FACHB-190]|uniref:ribbon-helix-helix domain-containing protein n=1 Tax=Nostoc sp. FACHB-190 TaxID=2692838 RepID=UPI00168797FA|nr:hypothetical protein [Nostoc sp. FACHB-190]MBD2302291.1 hypothetical protein [Nostoc sp. FACHB-190]